MNNFDAQAFYDLLLAHKWWGVAAVVIGILVRCTKDDRLVAWIPVSVAARWRPLLAVGLGIISGVVEAIAAGTVWPVALIGGIGSAITAMSAHAVVISSLRNGRELGVSKADMETQALDPRVIDIGMVVPPKKAPPGAAG
jgi:hypothetical protein